MADSPRRRYASPSPRRYRSRSRSRSPASPSLFLAPSSQGAGSMVERLRDAMRNEYIFNGCLAPPRQGAGSMVERLQYTMLNEYIFNGSLSMLPITETWVWNYGERNDSNNPGNNLYVTGLSTRVTEKDLEDHFTAEGKVLECRLVVDPRTRESRGFGFVTMDSLEDAERCIKYLNRSILEGRVITVEKAKRKRARTPTPGKYLGVRSAREISASLHDHDRRRGSREASRGDSYSSRRSPRYSPYRGGRDYSPQHSPYRGGSGGGHRRERSLSPYRSPPRRGYSYRSRSHSRSRSMTPYYR